ncbi:Early growth response protein 1-B [Fusarium austroafricanum]|uniref:Early growth response protein 1-B n=1 Tax=Fusarium austroafricanum TaxID=2364996 RepID=A0A8H4KMC6_9HYPO|nr:Early growth response protein 1-B [Fusarium austroafricanum]
MDRLFEIAEDFRRSLKSHHEEEFENTSMGAMRREIHDIQLLRDKTSNMMNMNRLRMFLSGMEELEKVLLQLQFPGARNVMSIIWGSVRFLLKVNHCRSNDILWQRLQKPIWDDTRRMFDRISQSLNTHATFIKTNSTSSQELHKDYGEIHAAFQQYSYSIKSAWKDFETREETRKHEKRHEVIIWISASGKMQRLQDTFRKMAICPRSGRWLFRNYSAISEWMGEEEPPDSAIWLHGNCGYGKTVLASLIVDELKSPKSQETFSSFPDGSQTCYFYCQEDDGEHQSHLDILKGILLQLMEADDYILPLCHQEKVTSGGTNLLDARLAEKLIKTFVEYLPRQYIVIDGIDECEGTEIQQTAKFFKDLVLTYDTQIRLGHLRVLFMGRETSETRKYIPGDDCIAVPLRPEDNHDDIRAFVQKKLPEFSKSSHGAGFSLSEAHKADVERTICHQSQDSFLYAHLAIEFLLQQDTKGELVNLLKQGILPTKLGDMYERLLDSVRCQLLAQPGGEKKWQRSKLLFGWLVCAKRPLRWHEMQAILCFDQSNLKVDFENKMLRQDMERYLGSIVHVLDDGNIRLIHSTARRHIIENKHIKEKQVQCQLTTICLRYLSLPCFTKDPDYQSQQRTENAKLGWFSFQDYACSQWLYHVDTVIRDCSSIFITQTTSDVVTEFTSALKQFVDFHREDLTDTDHVELNEANIKDFLNLELYDDLRLVWNHIYTHQRGDYGVRNTIGISQIDAALQDNRTELERFLPDQKVGDEDTIEDYYGSNLFKCRRTLCRFFYVGYDKKAARDTHEKRHERPFQCPISCNSAPLGFVSNKDRDRHINIYHPQMSEGPMHFSALSRRQVPGKFICKICEKSFTRNINLKSHERSHFGDRPFACSTCGKAFARLNDCRRHEKIHARRGY